MGFAYAPGSWALKHVDLAVVPGERVALLGGNGAGKSTLLLMMNGAEKPCAGAVYLDGEPIAYTRDGLRRVRRKVGILLQDPEDQLLAPVVEHDVAIGPLLAGAEPAEARRAVREALCAMEIEHLAERPIHELSAGEKKRVALAGLVALRPCVLLLDEPTAGLDPAGVRALLSVLETVRQQGTAIVQATHDVNLAYAWADSVCVLWRGMVLGAGTAKEVLNDQEKLARAGLELPFQLRHFSSSGRRLR